MTTLLERVQKATGPDREIDYDISRLADGELARQSSLHLPYTASVDAILALIERELPGLSPSIGMNIHHKHWVATIQSVGQDGSVIENRSAYSTTPALALCAAFLAAKEK